MTSANDDLFSQRTLYLIGQFKHDLIGLSLHGQSIQDRGHHLDDIDG